MIGGVVTLIVISGLWMLGYRKQNWPFAVGLAAGITVNLLLLLR